MYTKTVEEILRNEFHLTGGYNDLIENGPNLIFDNYPIFDEAYRPALERKILRHYMTREISEEGTDLWKFRISQTMWDNMPYFNQLYKSELWELNPLYETDITTTHEGSGTQNETGSEDDTGTVHNEASRSGSESGETHDTSNGTSSETKSGNDSLTRDEERKNEEVHGDTTNENVSRETSSTKTSHTEESDTESNQSNSTKNYTSTKGSTASGTQGGTSTEVYSDTPQGGLTGLESGNYLTNARKVTNNQTNSSTASENGSWEETNHDVTEGSKQSEIDANETDEIKEKSSRESIVTGEHTSEDKSHVTESRTTSDTSSGTTGSTSNGTSNVTSEGTENSTRTDNLHRARENEARTTEQYIQKVQGRNSSAGKLLMEAREAFLNIDKMVIESLADCFFNLY